MTMSFLNRAALRILPALAAIGFVACTSPEPSQTTTRTVTIYVSTDRVFSEPVLRQDRCNAPLAARLG